MKSVPHPREATNRKRASLKILIVCLLAVQLALVVPVSNPAHAAVSLYVDSRNDSYVVDRQVLLNIGDDYTAVLENRSFPLSTQICYITQTADSGFYYSVLGTRDTLEFTGWNDPWFVPLYVDISSSEDNCGYVGVTITGDETRSEEVIEIDPSLDALLLEGFPGAKSTFLEEGFYAVSVVSDLDTRPIDSLALIAYYDQDIHLVVRIVREGDPILISVAKGGSNLYAFMLDWATASDNVGGVTVTIEESSALFIGDVDCSGGIDIDDVVYLIEYIFLGGDPPCSGPFLGL